jgi:hypothetical protein
MKRFPIRAAKEVAQKYNQDEVILVTRDRKNNLIHVVSYGKTLVDCADAANSANNLRKHLGFPESACHEVPRRLR